MNEKVQSVFENVKTTALAAGQVAGQTLDSAGKKFNKQVEIVRANNQISDLNKNADDLCLEIGRLVYSAHIDPESDPKEKVDELLGKLDEKYGQIRDLQNRVNDTREGKTCPGCSKSLDVNDDFCRFCGKAL